LSISCKCDNVPVTCSDAVAVNLDPPTATCPENNVNFGPKEEVSFATTLTNCATGCNYTVTHKGSTMEAGSGATSASSTTISFTDATARSGENTYTFTVTNGDGGTTSGGSDSCEFVVDYKNPVVTCPDSEHPYNVEPGATVTFEPASLNYCGGGCKDSVKISDSPVYGINAWTYTSSAEVTFNSRSVANQTSDTYTFKVTNQANKSASCDFTVNYLKPSYNCPADMTKATGATVTVTPTNVQNCSNGCSYVVREGSTSGTAVIGPSTSSSYSSGDIGSFTGPTSATSKSYYVILTNPAGSPATPCHFDVTYQVKTCTEDLTNFVVPGSNANIDITGTFTNGCFDFFTRKSCAKVQVENTTGSGTITVNGSEFDCGYVASTTITANTTVRLDVPSTCTVGKLYMHECTASAASSSSVSANTVVVTAGWGSDGDKVTAPATTTKIVCKDAPGANPEAKKLRMGVTTGTATVKLGGNTYNLTNDVNAFSPIDCTDGTELELETTVAVIFLLKNG